MKSKWWGKVLNFFKQNHGSEEKLNDC